MCGFVASISKFCDGSSGIKLHELLNGIAFELYRTLQFGNIGFWKYTMCSRDNFISF